MSGNRQIYDQAMNMGHSAAWDQDWDRAIAAYGRAVQEMPEDAAAHNSLGLALLQARRLEDALKVYTRAHQLSPDDPIPLEKSADVLERLGRLKEAAQQYVNVAEIYLAQRDLEKAIGNWERATRLSTGLVQIHQRLALAYEKIGQRRSAIREYLTLAFNFQRADRTDIAIQAVERALRLEPNNPQALNTLAALQTGALISMDIFEDDERSKQQATQEQAFDRSMLPQAEVDAALASAAQRDIGASDVRGPIGEAVEAALALLANFVFESGELDEGGLQAIQAIEYQRQGQIAEAIGAYERALAAKMRHPAVYMNLGAMRLENQEWKKAIENFEYVSQGTDLQLVAGAAHGMATAFAAQKNPRTAARHLIQTLRLVDVGMALNNDEAAQLGAIYDRLIASTEESEEKLLEGMNARFLTLLTGPDWKLRVAKTRRQLEESVTLHEPDSLVSIALYADDRVTEGLSSIDRYMREGLHLLAIDQAHFLIEKAPDYLPIHLRVGQILLERNNIGAAIEKYNLVAETYLMRGDQDRAAEILHEVIKIAPMDTSLHRNLIKLYDEQNRWPELLSQYISMADAYYQLADFDNARATCQSAIQLAQRINAPHEQMIQILHRLGEIDVNRMDLRQAMRNYEQIRKLDAEDDRARRALVDLNYRLNDPVSAVQELDGLLRVYARQRKANQIIRVLEELVTRFPTDMALRSRLSAVYRQTGNVAKAIEQLDSLAELQLESGLHSDAMVTIRRIIEMNPPRVEDYVRLLQQLSG